MELLANENACPRNKLGIEAYHVESKGPIFNESKFDKQLEEYQKAQITMARGVAVDDQSGSEEHKGAAFVFKVEKPPHPMLIKMREKANAYNQKLHKLM